MRCVINVSKLINNSTFAPVKGSHFYAFKPVCIKDPYKHPLKSNDHKL